LCSILNPLLNPHTLSTKKKKTQHKNHTIHTNQVINSAQLAGKLAGVTRRPPQTLRNSVQAESLSLLCSTRRLDSISGDETILTPCILISGDEILI
jgi:hypothetical protein